MKQERKNKWRNISLNSLADELRGLSDVVVPETLKARLFGDIPAGNSKATSRSSVRFWPGVCRLGMAAAIILGVGLMFWSNYGPSGPAGVLVSDLNDRSFNYTSADHNGMAIGDNNYVSYDGNNSSR